MIAERARFARALARKGGLDGLIAAVHAALGVSPELTEAGALAAACADATFDGAGL